MLKHFSELAALPLGSNPKAGGSEDYGFEKALGFIEGLRLRLAGFDPLVGRANKKGPLWRALFGGSTTDGV